MLNPGQAAKISIVAVLIAGALSFGLWQLITTGQINGEELVMFTVFHAIIDAVIVGGLVYIVGKMMG